MATTWIELCDALHAAIVAASGLSPARVIWEWQDGSQPPNPYIAMGITAVSNPGQDGITATTDPKFGRDDARPAGREIELAVAGFREFTLGISAFGGGGLVDGADALSIVERIRSALLLPSVRDGLAAVGVTPFDIGASSHVPEIVSVGFEGRALLDVRCYVPAVPVSDFVGYIASVSGSLETDSGPQSFQTP